jgi:hypothetical protein
MGLDVPTNSWCSRYLDPQWGSPGTQSPCFGAERHLWDLNAKGSLCIHYWSIPCGRSFSSSNRANELWLKSMTVYCELYSTGYTMAISAYCVQWYGEWRGMVYLQYLMGFYFVVQQSIIVQSIYYWNVCILVQCLQVLHNYLGVLMMKLIDHKPCSLFGLHLYVILCAMVGGHC